MSGRVERPQLYVRSAITEDIRHAAAEMMPSRHSDAFSPGVLTPSLTVRIHDYVVVQAGRDVQRLEASVTVATSKTGLSSGKRRQRRYTSGAWRGEGKQRKVWGNRSLRFANAAAVG